MSSISALRALRSSLARQPALSARQARLLSTLAILEHRAGQISSASLPAVTAAAQLGGPVTAFLAGTDAPSVAAQAAALAGITSVLHVANPAYDKVPLPAPARARPG